MSAEFDRPTHAGATARPPAEERKAEIIDLDQDDRALIGKVIASQAKLEKSQDDLESSQKRLDAAWRTRSDDHEASMRELTRISRHLREEMKELSRYDQSMIELRSELSDVRETVKNLLLTSGKHARQVSNVPKLVTAGIVIIEIAKGILHHYGIFG